MCEGPGSIPSISKEAKKKKRLKSRTLLGQLAKAPGPSIAMESHCLGIGLCEESKDRALIPGGPGQCLEQISGWHKNSNTFGRKLMTAKNNWI
jgi:hypothetical protein